MEPAAQAPSGSIPADTTNRSTLLVYHNGTLGDFVTFLPALRVARRARPHARLVMLTRPAWGELAGALDLCDQSLDTGSAAAASLFRSQPGSSPRHTLLDHLPLPLTEALLVTGSRALVENCRAAGIQEVHAYPPLPDREVRMAEWHLRQVATALGGDLDRLPPPEASLLPGTETDARHIEAFPVALIHPGSGSPLKSWRPEALSQVAQALRRSGYRVVWSFGPDEHRRQSRRREVDPQDTVLPELRPADLLPVLSAATLYLGVDSGVTHLAAAAGVPVFALFGPSNDRVWRPAGTRVTLVTDRSCCLQCAALAPQAWDRPHCSRVVSGRAACLQNIPAARVLRSLRHAGFLPSPPPLRSTRLALRRRCR